MLENNRAGPPELGPERSLRGENTIFRDENQNGNPSDILI